MEKYIPRSERHAKPFDKLNFTNQQEPCSVPAEQAEGGRAQRQSILAGVPVEKMSHEKAIENINAFFNDEIERFQDAHRFKEKAENALMNILFCRGPFVCFAFWSIISFSIYLGFHFNLGWIKICLVSYALFIAGIFSLSFWADKFLIKTQAFIPNYRAKYKALTGNIFIPGTIEMPTPEVCPTK